MTTDDDVDKGISEFDKDTLLGCEELIDWEIGTLKVCAGVGGSAPVVELFCQAVFSTVLTN